ncbi:iron complex transport system substrate-binding protein [Actinopolyspora mzabensis]|uniref:Iron complex transport system substrate-binding protein n=1 Tax=Actinopolyspora mzabensis TaxID=995066 RepID=A0A1G9AZG2_ACTMZ|nr:iron-siderophore ABC transporter substrate-binding protein [Actinopolyspora mzabensis]SDK32711.1 iron complex transport system substrate-binding protein [Actinopolyspora mzabensis]
MSEVTRTRRELLRTALTAASALPVLGLTACGGESDSAGQSGRTNTRTVEHAMGETEITGTPKRVVALDATFTSATMALGTDVVGYTTFGGREELPAYLGRDRTEYGAQAQGVGSLTSPDAERIVQREPDLILSAKVRHQDMYEQLSEIAPTVFSRTTGATWKENLLLTGRALGKEKTARNKLDEYERRAKTVGDSIRSKVGHNPTMSIVRFAGEPTVRLYSADSFPGTVQQDTGLARPEGQPEGDGIAVNLSQERIPELDAEHIFVTVYPDEAGDAAETRKTFESNPLWSKLTGKQHLVDDITWMTSVGIHGAHAILDDLANAFGVDAAR